MSATALRVVVNQRMISAGGFTLSSSNEALVVREHSDEDDDSLGAGKESLSEVQPMAHASICHNQRWFGAFTHSSMSTCVATKEEAMSYGNSRQI